MSKQSIFDLVSGHIFRAKISEDLNFDQFNKTKLLSDFQVLSQNPYTIEILKMKGLTKKFILDHKIWGQDSKYIFARLYSGTRERKSILWCLDWLETDDWFVQRASSYNLCLDL